VTSPKKRAYLPPEGIRANHRLSEFDCGKQKLNDWLAKHALTNEGRASRTYVVVEAGEGGQVVAFYALAAGSVALPDLPRRLRHDLPNPVPVMVLGRLAVDARHQGAGLGPAMLREAMLRTLEVARSAGVRAIVVHPIDEDAAEFYAHYGFAELGDGKAMFLSVEDLMAAL
jgi:predicted N-acetyltransferase YhbS